MKKILAVFLALSVLAVPVLAETTEDAAPTVTKYTVLGKGISSSPSDPMDFMIVKVGLGRVITSAQDIAVGVMKLDEEKYRLRDVEIETGHATGNVYDGETVVGSFDVSSVMKGDTEVWAGTLEIDGSEYNLYVIEGVRPIKAGELRAVLVDYCRNNEDVNCEERIHEFCSNNPGNAKCQALFRAYCLKGDNMDDTRCRNAFRTWCQKNPTNKYCVPFELQRAKSYCEENPDATICQRIATAAANRCKDNPDNEGCAVAKQIVTGSSNMLRNAQTLRNRFTNMKVNAAAVNASVQAAVQKGKAITSADVAGGD